MTEDQADEVLLLMSQLWWKSGNIPDGTLQIWHNSLLELDRNVVSECVNDLVRDYPYWPAVSEFRSHYQSVMRRTKMGIKAIERDYLPREENVRRLRELKESLRSKG